jgi:hypothetical protein
MVLRERIKQIWWRLAYLTPKQRPNFEDPSCLYIYIIDYVVDRTSLISIAQLGISIRLNPFIVCV